ncbi:hypothetical protein OM416_19175 [Paenibacillus sp. LS1]|uniref:hypothetical protein n=1 Tax=Paenibacillus sp. LS1 TaxID=2992120 RepID=UPI00223236FC|nr:hypothetical protein [Paenibacillus sp. LS1]MCW3793718.1 hypothetical protein [Paenibacillus sp. LS1]
MEGFYGVIYFVAGKYPKNVMDRIKELSGIDAPIVMDDMYYAIDNPYAANGCFQELEDFFIEKGIPFDRNSDSFYEIQPESRIYRPDELDSTVIKDNEGYEYVRAYQIVDILKEENMSDTTKLLSIQELVQEQIPALTKLSDYQILWKDESNSTPFTPSEDYEANGEVKLIFIKSEKTDAIEHNAQIEKIVDEILNP